MLQCYENKIKIFIVRVFFGPSKFIVKFYVILVLNICTLDNISSTYRWYTTRILIL